MVLIIDNYDSFTYNLLHIINEDQFKVSIFYNDQIGPDEIQKIKPSHIIISPGPGHPVNAGNSNDIIKTFHGSIPILGICLGHQCIAHSFGGNIIHAKKIMHGKTSLIQHNQLGLFSGLPSPFLAGRYHSLAIGKMPDQFDKTAWTDDWEIMAITHRTLPTFGVQFHPESFLTPNGRQIMDAFLHV